MLKFVLAFFLVFLLSGCGVQTSSSPSESSIQNETTPTTNNDGVSLDLIDPNPIVLDENSTDSNESNVTPTEPDTGEEVSKVQIEDSLFDSVDAVKDDLACMASNGYGAIHDNSYYSGVYTDVVNGLEFSSLVPYGTNGEFSEGYEATLYRPSLAVAASESYVFVLEAGKYSITFDEAWIFNTNNTVYVKIAKDYSKPDSKPSCFRLKLNSKNLDEISPVKVYRIL
jgi:hypothetical protein